MENEADDIDINLDKMRIYKKGYNSGSRVSRMDISYGRKQYSYWTYCFKAFSAERQPDENKGKGFNERTLVPHCRPGIPKYDISEITCPAGDERYEELREELLYLRKLLLMYRLLLYQDPIPNIELAVSNREKQLCTPLLRLFQNSEGRRSVVH